MILYSCCVCLRVYTGLHNRRRLNRDHRCAQLLCSLAQLPVDDKELLRSVAAVHILQRGLPVNRLAGGLEAGHIQIVQAVDQRLVLGRDGRLVQAARLEHIRVDVEHVARGALPLVGHCGCTSTLLRIHSKVVKQRIVGPLGEPKEVQARRIATQGTHAVVLGRAQLVALARGRVLYHNALCAPLELVVLGDHKCVHIGPGRQTAERRQAILLGDGRLAVRNHLHVRAARAHTAHADQMRARDRRGDHNAVLRMLQNPVVVVLLNQRAVIQVRRGLCKQLRKGLGLAEVAARGVQRGARVNAPAVTVSVPEHTHAHTIHKRLHNIGVREGVLRRKPLAVHGLEGECRHRYVLGHIPYNRAECADVRECKVADALGVADQGVGALRRGIVIHAQTTALGAGQMRLERRPRGVGINQGRIHGMGSGHLVRNETDWKL
jgi:hypothetical protein